MNRYDCMSILCYNDGDVVIGLGLSMSSRTKFQSLVLTLAFTWKIESLLTLLFIISDFFDTLILSRLHCADEDVLSEPCMSDIKKKLARVQGDVKQLKKARTRMKVLTQDIPQFCYTLKCYCVCIKRAILLFCRCLNLMMGNYMCLRHLLMTHLFDWRSCSKWHFVNRCRT